MITSDNIKNFSSLCGAGVFPRKLRQGPELEFLLSYLQNSLPQASEGEKLTIFIEPKVESVFPDAVAVYWNTETTKNWNESRKLLTRSDVRVLHFLALTRTARLSNLEHIFSKRVISSLERLEKAELIYRTPRTWKAKSLREIFAVTKLITVEAKISDWNQGLLQAFFHTWFASESYLLIQRLPKEREKLILEAARLGIGVISEDVPLKGPFSAARRHRIPKSHASWFFNEWAWRVEQEAV